MSREEEEEEVPAAAAAAAETAAAAAAEEEEECWECPTPSRKILSLRSDVAHQICSGQVVTDLASAAKELVDNALDAGASRVDVRVSGTAWLEVADNGVGVGQEDFGALARRHCTSKIAEFEDIDSVQSFGFRGEALASLVELCEDEGVEVVTRTAKDDAASKLTLGRDGEVVRVVQCARQVGTTVKVSGLFKPLPVRRRQLEKGSKAQVAKLLLMLQSYAIISNGVRISCTVVEGNNKKKVALQTAGSDAMKTNIISVCGPSLANQIIPVDLVFFEEDDLRNVTSNSQVDAGSDSVFSENQNLTEPTDYPATKVLPMKDPVKLEGFVSKFGEGIGMASGDRQFWFVNKRPVDFPKGSKVLNMVWRQREMKHKPALFLNWVIPKGGCDINLTPDKREVFLSNETVLLTQLKTKFEQIWQRETSELRSHTVQGLWSRTPPPPQQQQANDSVAQSGEDLLLPNDHEDHRLQESSLTQTTVKKTTSSQGSNKRISIGDTAEPIDNLSSLSVRGRAKSSMLDFENKTDLAASDHAISSAEDEVCNAITSADKISSVENSIDIGDDSENSVKDDDLQPKRNEPSSNSLDQDGKDIEDMVDEDDDGASENDGISVQDDDDVDNSTSTSLKKLEPQRNTKRKRNGNREVLRRELAKAGYKVVDSSEPDDSDEESKRPTRLRAEKHDRVSTSKERRKKSKPNASENDELENENEKQDNLISLFDDANSDFEEGVDKVSSAQKTSDNEEEVVATTSKKRKSISHADVNISEPTTTPPPLDRQKEDVERRPKPSKKMKRASKTANKARYLLLQNTGLKDLRSALSGAIQQRMEDDNILKCSTQVTPVNDDEVASRVKDVSGKFSERVFSKVDFGRTEVLGQFNKGFVVGRTKDDIYIFDQHACDEKYRFETLQKVTKIKEQPLIRPFPLDLSATDTEIVKEHVDIFEYNGFRFTNESLSGHSETATSKLSLVAIPHSFKTQFGAEDVRELASILRESPPPPKVLRERLGYVPPRLPRTRAMFASRACRSAIMIGDELNHSKMYKVLKNLVNLDQPWNCPHGRPTMRHLMDLGSLYEKRGRKAQSYLALE